MTKEDRVRKFAQDLIDTKRGIIWRPFVKKEDVRAELFARGYELIEDGADWNPALLRFYVTDHAVARVGYKMTAGFVPRLVPDFVNPALIIVGPQERQAKPCAVCGSYDHERHEPGHP